MSSHNREDIVDLLMKLINIYNMKYKISNEEIVDIVSSLFSSVCRSYCIEFVEDKREDFLRELFQELLCHTVYDLRDEIQIRKEEERGF